MADMNVIRDLHTEFCGVYESLVAIFGFCGSDHEQIETAARPAMQLFNVLLERADVAITQGEEVSIR